MKQPQRCAVGKCGCKPTQIEYYETSGDGTGGNGIPVCGNHTGMAAHKWRLSGVEPIPGRIDYKTASR